MPNNLHTCMHYMNLSELCFLQTSGNSSMINKLLFKSDIFIVRFRKNSPYHVMRSFIQFFFFIMQFSFK